MLRHAFPFSALTLAGMAACAAAPSDPGLVPDFGYWLDCAEQLSQADQVAIEERLFAAGFDVLNSARLAAEKQIRYSSPIKIDALDKRGRLVSLRGFEANSGFEGDDDRPFTIAISLYSEPPTRRDAGLEATLLSLATGKTGCSARGVHRDTNGADSTATYRETTKLAEGWFEQARAMAPTSTAVRLH